MTAQACDFVFAQGAGLALAEPTQLEGAHANAYELLDRVSEDQE